MSEAPERCYRCLAKKSEHAEQGGVLQCPGYIGFQACPHTSVQATFYENGNVSGCCMKCGTTVDIRQRVLLRHSI